MICNVKISYSNKLLHSVQHVLYIEKVEFTRNFRILVQQISELETLWPLRSTTSQADSAWGLSSKPVWLSDSGWFKHSLWHASDACEVWTMRLAKRALFGYFFSFERCFAVSGCQKQYYIVMYGFFFPPHIFLVQFLWKRWNTGDLFLSGFLPKK